MTLTHLAGALLLIPAGLAGISAGLQTLLGSIDALPGLLEQLRGLLAPITPLCEGLFCLTAGGAILALAAVTMVRGLQSDA